MYKPNDVVDGFYIVLEGKFGVLKQPKVKSKYQIIKISIHLSNTSNMLTLSEGEVFGIQDCL